MPEFKIVINDVKTGKSYQKIVSESNAERLIGLKIKDKVKGELIGLKGYELEITGGSDFCGFPMKESIQGIAVKKLILSKGPGFRIKERAKKHSQNHYHIKKRKTIRGNTISPRTSQINLKIINYGKTSLKDIFKEKPTEEKPEEKKGAKKEEVKETEKEKPKEESKTKEPKKHGKENTKKPAQKK